MRADDRASLATRQRKDETLTPERLRDRWHDEATTVGLEPGAGVDDLVVGRGLDREAVPGDAELFAALVDPATGLCASDSRFGEAHVVERVAAISAGRLTTEEIVAVSERFLASGLVVRLVPSVERRRPAEWSTVEHRAVEDRLLAGIHALAATPRASVDVGVVDRAIASEPKRLGRRSGRRGARPVRRGWRTPSVHRARRVRQDHRAARRRDRPARRRPPRGRVGTDPSGGRRAPRRRSRRPDHRPLPRRTPGPADTSRHHRDRRRDLTSRYS